MIIDGKTALKITNNSNYPVNVFILPSGIQIINISNKPINREEIEIKFGYKRKWKKWGKI